MTRTNRIALLAALTLLVAATGTVLATRVPQAQRPTAPLADEADEAGGALDADAIARAVERLAERGIDTDAVALGDYAARYGLGGAVRLHAWADETGMTVEDIAALRDGEGGAPMGWGRLVRELGVHPGIGWLMGNGRGAGDPPGQEHTADE